MFNKTNNPLIFYGTLNGICVNPRGQNTYDWDSIFEPTKESGGNGQTYAEMPIDYKNTISQRNKALNEIKAFLCNN
jgi:inosine/xanthosine triphosphate pyrophosphatase family protein